MAKRSKHQESIIRNYYKNRDSIALQKLGERVTDLYLAQGKARDKVWQNIMSSLKNLGVPQKRIDHLREKDDPELLAGLVTELMAGK